MLRHMRSRILTMATILIVMLSMIGIVTACPSKDSGHYTDATPYDYLGTNVIDNGDIRTYVLNTVDPGRDASVIEYCVYPTPGFTGDTSDLEAIYVGAVGEWQTNHPGSQPYFGFGRGAGGDNNNVPIDGTVDIEIGSTGYIDTLPTSEVILFHINDPIECGASGTCWRKQGTPPPAVPELNTMILASAGMLGLILVSRRYK